MKISLCSKKIASLVFVLCSCAAAGCTARGYSGPALPPDKVSTVSLHKIGGATFDSIVFDGRDISTFADNVELTPGRHDFRLYYQIDEPPIGCDDHDFFCTHTYHKGVCEGRLTTKPGRTYLVTVENHYSQVDVRVASKGYFNLFEREDEPQAGSGACRELPGW